LATEETDHHFTTLFTVFFRLLLLYHITPLFLLHADALIIRR